MINAFNKFLKVTRLRTVVLIFCVVALTGCSTMIPVSPRPESIKANIHAGDTIKVTTNENSAEQTYVVAKVQGDSMLLQNGFRPLPMSDIKTLSKRKFDGTKTTILVVSIVGGTVLVVGVMYVAAVASMFATI